MASPIIRHCLLCEDIRLELRNLVSFMGVYGAIPYAGIKVADLKLPVIFCLVFLGDPIDGKFAMKLNLFSRDGRIVEANTAPPINEQTFSREFPITFAFRVSAIFPRPDTYTIVVSSNGTEFFKDALSITEGPI